MIDYAIQNGSNFPTDDKLKKEFGHDLVKLFTFCYGISKSREYIRTLGLTRSSIEHEIVIFLSEVARRTRYYNLDLILKSDRAASDTDPVQKWHSVIGSRILKRHFTSRMQAKAHLHAQIGARIQDYVHLSVMHDAEDGSELNDFYSASMQTSKTKVIQKYGTFYAAQICCYIYGVLYNIVFAAHRHGIPAPYLYEHFYPFSPFDDDLLKRKTFPPRNRL